MIDVSDCGKSKEDGQKVATINTEVRNRGSRVKRIRKHNMAKNEGENGGGGGGSKWLKGKGESREEEDGVGGCCHSEAKAITHLLLKIMKKT